jgi:hypothetical protein
VLAPGDGSEPVPIRAVRTEQGVTVVGDPAGVAAMQRNPAPAKSAEELERAFGAARPRPDDAVNASGTSAASGTPLAPPPNQPEDQGDR